MSPRARVTLALVAGWYLGVSAANHMWRKTMGRFLTDEVETYLGKE